MPGDSDDPGGEAESIGITLVDVALASKKWPYYKALPPVDAKTPSGTRSRSRRQWGCTEASTKHAAKPPSGPDLPFSGVWRSLAGTGDDFLVFFHLWLGYRVSSAGEIRWMEPVSSFLRSVSSALVSLGSLNLKLPCWVLVFVFGLVSQLVVLSLLSGDVSSPSGSCSSEERGGLEFESKASMLGFSVCLRSCFSYGVNGVSVTVADFWCLRARGPERLWCVAPTGRSGSGATLVGRSERSLQGHLRLFGVTRTRATSWRRFRKVALRSGTQRLRDVAPGGRSHARCYVLPVVWVLDSLLWAKFPRILRCFRRFGFHP
ncbi:hypothetical protein F2Q69_00060798 [Brassica cretica]|uniref:Uncharacterized protein n=1 Tax=Brassica cretica TaxID=69181 RepID=A0A8S9RDE2_BRACR|nr:hypothetical protein F2Q69_00060798 [Brassica cretica]